MNTPVQRQEYHIAFSTTAQSTREPHVPIPNGWIKAVKVTLEYDMLPPEHGELAEKYNVALVEHALFPDLERYVFVNGLRTYIPKVVNVRKHGGNVHMVMIEFDKPPTKRQVDDLRACLMRDPA